MNNLPQHNPHPASGSLPRRLAYIHDANVYGGMEVLQLAMLQHLDPARFYAHVLVSGYDDTNHSSPPEFIAQLVEAGVPLLKPPHPGYSPVLGTLRDVRNVAALLRGAGIEVVHLQTRHPEAARKATVAAWLAGVRAIIRTEHLPPSHHMRWMSRYTVVPFDWLTSYIVADSQANREEQLALLGRPTHKVRASYCGIDTARLCPEHDVAAAKQSIGLRPDLPVVGAIGRLHVQKGHQYFIAAAAEVLRAYGPVQFVLVGDGPLMGELRAQVAQLGLSECFHFMGFQAEYIPYMEAMDIGVMPSLWEGFSISMQEFMALAKPMVVTDHGSFREALTHGQHGLLVPMRDADGIAAAVLQLLRNPQLGARLGQQALARVRSEFSIQRHMLDLMTLYDSALHTRMARRAAL